MKSVEFRNSAGVCEKLPLIPPPRSLQIYTYNCVYLMAINHLMATEIFGPTEIISPKKASIYIVQRCWFSTEEITSDSNIFAASEPTARNISCTKVNFTLLVLEQ